MKIHFKQIPVPFKIYADLNCNFKSIKCDQDSYTKKYQDLIPCSFTYKEKLFALILGLLSQLLFIEVKMLFMNLLKQFFKSINIAEK